MEQKIESKKDSKNEPKKDSNKETKKESNKVSKKGLNKESKKDSKKSITNLSNYINNNENIIILIITNLKIIKVKMKNQP